MKIAIVGAGISGLLSAWVLSRRSDCQIKIFEKAPRSGGWLQSERKEGALMEWGPHSILWNSRWESLRRDLSLDLVSLKLKRPSRYIWQGDLRLALPMGIWSFIQSSFFSGAEKRKILKALLSKNSPLEEDLSVADFFRLRFPERVVSDVVDPFISGIYAGSVNELSAAACFPQVWDAWRGEKSVIQMLFSPSKKPRSEGMKSFAGGMQELVDRLSRRFENSLVLGSEVSGLEREASQWKLSCRSSESESFDRVILATEAKATAKLLGSLISPESSEALEQIPYQDVAVWNCLWNRPPSFQTGLGCLLPSRFGERLLGSLWPSEFFTGRAPEGKILTAQYFSGKGIPSDPLEELGVIKNVLGSEFSEPILSSYRVLEAAIPQYRLGHRLKIQRLEKELPPQIDLVGNYLTGVGLSAVMERAWALR